MDNIINKILEIDQQAQKKIDSANSEKSEKLNSIESDRGALIKELAGKSSEKIDYVSEIENSYADSKIDAIHERREKVIKHMEDSYAESGSDWVEQIYMRVLKNAE